MPPILRHANVLSLEAVASHHLEYRAFNSPARSWSDWTCSSLCKRYSLLLRSWETKSHQKLPVTKILIQTLLAQRGNPAAGNKKRCSLSRPVRWRLASYKCSNFLNIKAAGKESSTNDELGAKCQWFLCWAEGTRISTLVTNPINGRPCNPGNIG